MQAFQLGTSTVVAIRGTNTALRYARWLFQEMGVRIMECDDAPCPENTPLMVAGGVVPRDDESPALTVCLWDFHVNRPGSGVQASAVSGVSWVIGLPGKAPLYLAAHIPEKWCGTLGASFALSYYVERQTLPPGSTGPARRFDVSAAEILRGFADQNFGNHRQIPESWRRNGRISPEHGGIYPQGFFPCKDGYVAVIGRSRQDWANILAALGDPDWATAELRNPFHLAHHPEAVDSLFAAELERRTRAELLDLALVSGATFAPLYASEEIGPAKLVRDEFFDANGAPGLPFEFVEQEIRP